MHRTRRFLSDRPFLLIEKHTVILDFCFLFEGGVTVIDKPWIRSSAFAASFQKKNLLFQVLP